MMNYLISMNRHLRISIFLSGFFISFIIFFATGNGYLILLALLFLGILITSNLSHAKNYSAIMEEDIEKALINSNFKADASYLSDDYLSGVALNKSEGKIAIFRRFNIKEEFTPSVYNFKDILECSIKEDEDTVIKTINSSLIGRAMAGGVLFGSVGAAIGGITGEKIASQKIYKATLSLVFDDIDYPIHEINFLNSKMLVDRNSELYQKIYSDLNKWHKTISVIIKRNERELNSKLV